MTNTYCFAGIPIQAEFSGDYCRRLLSGYESSLPPTLSVSVSREDIAAERSMAEQNFSDDYLESLALLRKLSAAFSKKNVLLFHASAIEFDGKAYLYTAISGTGKSTHAALCKQVFGERVRYINDDKPFLRYENGRWTVFGSPWCGKHRLGENISAPLGGIAILKRGSENSIKRVSGDYALPTLLLQSYRPKEAENMQNVLELAVKLSETPVYELLCTISPQAAEVSLGKMSSAIE